MDRSSRRRRRKSSVGMGLGAIITGTVIGRGGIPLYELIVSRKGLQWRIRRRYEDFESLHEQLQSRVSLARMSASVLPRLPSGRTLFKSQATITQERMAGLNQYLRELLFTPLSHTGEVAQFFDVGGHRSLTSVPTSPAPGPASAPSAAAPPPGPEHKLHHALPQSSSTAPTAAAVSSTAPTAAAAGSGVRDLAALRAASKAAAAAKAAAAFRASIARKPGSAELPTASVVAAASTAASPVVAAFAPASPGKSQRPPARAAAMLSKAGPSSAVSSSGRFEAVLPPVSPTGRSRASSRGKMSASRWSVGSASVASSVAPDDGSGPADVFRQQQEAGWGQQRGPGLGAGLGLGLGVGSHRGAAPAHIMHNMHALAKPSASPSATVAAAVAAAGEASPFGGSSRATTRLETSALSTAHAVAPDGATPGTIPGAPAISGPVPGPEPVEMADRPEEALSTQTTETTEAATVSLSTSPTPTGIDRGHELSATRSLSVGVMSSAAARDRHDLGLEVDGMQVTAASTAGAGVDVQRGPDPEQLRAALASTGAGGASAVDDKGTVDAGSIGLSAATGAALSGSTTVSVACESADGHADGLSSADDLTTVPTQAPSSCHPHARVLVGEVVAGGAGEVVAGGAGAVGPGGAGEVDTGGAGEVDAGAGEVAPGGAGEVVAGGAGEVDAGAGEVGPGGAGDVGPGGAGEVGTGGVGELDAGGAGEEVDAGGADEVGPGGAGEVRATGAGGSSAEIAVSSASANHEPSGGSSQAAATPTGGEWTPDRHALVERWNGWVDKKGGGRRKLIGRRNWLRRYLVLDSGRLSYYKSRKEFLQGAKPLKNVVAKLRHYRVHFPGPEECKSNPDYVRRVSLRPDVGGADRTFHLRVPEDCSEYYRDALIKALFDHGGRRERRASIASVDEIL